MNAIENIAKAVYNADIFARSKLIARIIINERDYMSQLVALLNYPFGANTPLRRGYHCYVHSRVLDDHHEQGLGSDVLFAFRYRNLIKLLCVESKRLKFTSHIDNWDNLVTPTESRFSRQIRKQSSLSGQVIAAYEMFLNDLPTSTIRPGYDRLGSSLAQWQLADRHRLANVSTRTSKIWRWPDADLIVRQQSLICYPSIYWIVRKLLECEIGLALPLGSINGDSNYTFTANGETYNLPVPDLRDVQQGEPWIEKFKRKWDGFLETTGLDQIVFFQPSGEGVDFELFIKSKPK